MMWQRVSCDKERVDVPGTKGTLMLGDALNLDLSAYEGRVQCIYFDPPSINGERYRFRMRIGEVGWNGGKRHIDLPAFNGHALSDKEGYINFLTEHIQLAKRLLTPSGSFFLHADWRFSAHARIICDKIFGEAQFRNEIIWSYQTGGISKRYFSRKHDTILFYAKTRNHYFDITQVPTSKKSERSNHLKRHVDPQGKSYRSITTGGKTYIYYDDEPSYPDDVWTDLSQMQQKDPQRTGYATQKPVILMDRMILCATKSGDIVADLMCGSGTTLVSAAQNNRQFLGVDIGRNAYSVTRKRLADTALTCFASYSNQPMMMDATVIPGIAYYDVMLNSYTLPANIFEKLHQDKSSGKIIGLDAVDQWYAGLINGEAFVVYASSVRLKQTPKLDQKLSIPLLKGTIAILIIDVLGNRSLWTASNEI
ncbi:MAG: site-specific DNA-methyltransferase [Clostridiales bacterium]|nr:site-specific DNA-methyltransferase [Clostridiales bacterium]